MKSFRRLLAKNHRQSLFKNDKALCELSLARETLSGSLRFGVDDIPYKAFGEESSTVAV
jgi:hypothetical protein